MSHRELTSGTLAFSHRSALYNAASSWYAAVTASCVLGRVTEFKFLETDGKIELQDLGHLLFPFLVLTGTNHKYSSLCIVLCFGFPLVVSFGLCYTAVLNLLSFQYCLSPDHLITKELNCTSLAARLTWCSNTSELVPAALACGLLSRQLSSVSHQLATGHCMHYFISDSRHLCLSAFLMFFASATRAT